MDKVSKNVRWKMRLGKYPHLDSLVLYVRGRLGLRLRLSRTYCTYVPYALVIDLPGTCRDMRTVLIILLFDLQIWQTSPPICKIIRRLELIGRLFHSVSWNVFHKRVRHTSE